ncbi:Uncharacterised protein [Chryseobacterium taklimakanense]|uniref:Uncharacterized protein n=1 Tax=Chryseobacterium taklimakanense TaxID=536441 RepID=A0A239XPM8_9FLAO|nr:hypothetical protein [Chryseobacterium taklimakanense]SNV48186.1 Uncharacterised protein [Chryseobacterium taklimakanense]
MKKFTIQEELPKKGKLEPIHIDEMRLNWEKEKLQRAEESLNKFVQVVQSVLGDLSAAKLKRLHLESNEVVQEELASRFQFPNASDQFNLDALGINVEPIYEMRKEFAHTWSSYSFQYKDGKFIADEDQAVFQQFYTYVDTPEKKKFISLLEQQVELYNEFKAAGLIRSYTHLREVFYPNMFTIDIYGNMSVKTDRLPSLLSYVGRYIQISV